LKVDTPGSSNNPPVPGISLIIIFDNKYGIDEDKEEDVVENPIFKSETPHEETDSYETFPTNIYVPGFSWKFANVFQVFCDKTTD